MTALSRTTALAFVLATLAAPTAHAHRMWMTPSSTVLSGADPWVTVDGAISNTLFFPDHNPMRLDGVKAIGPDGANVALENAATGKFRSTFDLHLAKPGTYRIVNNTDLMMATWKVGTETKRWRGPAAGMAAAVPKDAAELKVTRNQRRGETFVTAGAPNTTALKPTGQGLELDPITHPNDLVASEKARFRLLRDGQPAAGVEVTVAPGAARYRSDPGEMKLTTGADGVVEIAWPAPGMYWIEAEFRGDQPDASGVTHRADYTATFEVLPD